MDATARPLSRLAPYPAESEESFNLACTGSTLAPSELSPTSNAVWLGDKLRPYSTELQGVDDTQSNSAPSSSRPGKGTSLVSTLPSRPASAAMSGSSKEAISLAKRLSERGRPGLSGVSVKRAQGVTRLPCLTGASADQARSNNRQLTQSPRKCFEGPDVNSRNVKSKHVQFLRGVAEPDKTNADSSGQDVGAAKCHEGVLDLELRSTVNVENARSLFRHTYRVLGDKVTPARITRLDTAAEESSGAVQGLLREPETGLLHVDEYGAETIIAALWNAALHHGGDNQFMYARCRDSIYDIEVLPFSSCPRLKSTHMPETWVTIAVGGMTFHRRDSNGEQIDEEFVHLDTWIADRQKFLKLQKLQWYQMFPFRKMFAKWRHSTASAAQDTARDTLEKELLVLRPKYHKALCWLQTFCQTRLLKSAIVSRHCRGKQSVVVFREVIHSGRQEAALLVAKLDEELRVQISSVCNEIFADVLEDKFEGPLPTRKIRQRSTFAETALGVPGHKLTQTSRVRVRHECHRICRLVRMCNFMLKHHLHGLCRQEVFRILDAVVQLQATPTLSHSLENIVFIVKVNSRQRTCGAADSLRIGELILESDTETISKAIHEAMNGLVETLQLFRRLPCNPEFANYAEVADGQSGECLGEGSQVFGPEEFWPGFCLDSDLLSEAAVTRATSAATARIKESFDAAWTHLAETESFITNFQRARISDANQIGVSEDPVEELEQQMHLYVKSINHFKDLPERVPFGVLELDMSLLLQKIVESLRDCFRGIGLVLPRLLAERIQTSTAWVDKGLELVRLPFPENVKDFVYFMREVQVASSKVTDMRHVQRQLHDILALADEHKLPVGNNQRTEFKSLCYKFQLLVNELQRVEAMIHKRVAFFVGELDTIRPRLLEKIQSLHEEVLSPDLLTLDCSEGLLDPCADSPSEAMLESGDLAITFEDAVEESDLEKKFALLNILSRRLAHLSREVDELTDQQSSLYVRNNTCQVQLEALQAEFSSRQKLWNCVLEWNQSLSQWGKTNFHELRTRDVEQVCKKLSASLGELPISSISIELQARMNIMRVACEILQTLQRANLKERHWIQFAHGLGGEAIEIEFEEDISFSKIMDLGLLSSTSVVQELCHRSMQEDAIDQQLQNLDLKWGVLRLDVEPKIRDLDDLFLSNVTDIVEEVDDSLMLISTLATSPFVGPFLEKVREWQLQLAAMEETLEAWGGFESSWVAVRPILARADVAAHVQNTASYDRVDMWWTHLMLTVAQDNLAMKNLVEPGRFEEIKDHAEVLEQMQIDLDGLVETKRRRFPRLYFLGTADVLEMMRDEHSLACMRPHVRKCFDGIHDVVLEVYEESFERQVSDDLRKAKVDVLIGMASAQGETLHWGRVKHEPKLERLLLSIEEAMVRILRRQCWMSLGRLRGGASDTSEAFQAWILSDDLCAQANMMAGLVCWCRDVEVILGQQDSELKWIYEKHQSATLKPMFKALDIALTPVKRLSVTAHITVNMFCRDVLEFLCAARITRVSAFEWQRQQRWYWDSAGQETIEVLPVEVLPPTSEVSSTLTPTGSSTSINATTGSSGVTGLCMKQLAFEFLYGFEYYGVTSRIVITPLTERCWLTITQAIANKYSTVLLGPPGTGKTVSAQDLAKGLGVQCILFNCGADTDSKITRRMFCGLAQTGAWLCLNEFDCINVDALSVMAAQLLTLRCAVLANMREVDFEGKVIPVRCSLGLIVTTNPGLVGRHEFPDNLRVLFRPAAMIKPDFEYIAQVTLFVEQFKDAKILARRLALLFQVASQQLRHELHYDFGLRPLKTVLALAIQSHHSDESISEEVAVVHALRVVNIPKLVAEDKILFEALVSDIFTGVSKQLDSAEFAILEMCSKVIQNQGLGISEQLCRKVVQIRQTLQMQTGIILVGPPGSGKSTSLKCFAGVEKEIMRRSLPGSQDVEIKMVHHKVLHRDDLFGSVSMLNSQWKDGLLPHFLRSNAKHASTAVRKSMYVIGFDGPVDPGWTEDMNTLLDDNRTLCLASAERLHAPRNTHVLFETEDLEHASPATVSRCGIVHFSGKDIGWQPFFSLWVKQRLPESAPWLNEDDLIYLRELFEKLPGVLDLSLTWSKPSASYTDIQLVSSFTYLLEFVFSTRPREGEVVSPGRTMGVVHGVMSSSDRSAKKRRTLQQVKTHADPSMTSNTPFNAKRYLGASFAFALAWSVGNVTKNSERSDFQKWCLRYVPNFVLPLHCNVHDVFVDWSCEPQYLRPWTAALQAIPRLDFSSFLEVKIPTAVTVAYGFLGLVMCRRRHHVVLDGCKGSGKSLIADQILQHLWHNHQWSVLTVHFSRNIKTPHIQDVIEASHERTGTVFQAPPGKQVFILIDDVNMPASDAYGSQCQLEVLRQLIDREGFFDRQRWLFKAVLDTVLLMTPSPAAAHAQAVPQRLNRHCFVLGVPRPSLDIASSIFAPIFMQFFSFGLPDGTGFSRAITQLHNHFCHATSEIYQSIMCELKSTPSHFFYTYSLRDTLKVVSGMLLAHPTVVSNKTVATRLWAHEVLRVFGDRLDNEQDQLKFSGVISAVLRTQFGTEWHPALESVPLRFSRMSFMAKGEASAEEDEKQIKDGVYHELGRDEQHIGQQLGNHLDEYNKAVKPPLSRLALVFFSSAICHICRVHRILLEPAGHVMCLGLPGTGKRSLSVFAGFLAQCPAAISGYSENEVQQLLKDVLICCGLRGERRVLLFTDNHFAQADAIVDIVNTLLRSGDVGTAWTSDERDLICAKLVESRIARTFAQTTSSDLDKHLNGTASEEEDAASVESTDSVNELSYNRYMFWRKFLAQARRWFHVILCCSPAGGQLRSWCRCYPGLLGSCTVNLFTSWPEEALFAVSLHFFSNSVETGVESVRKVCDQIHLLTEAACERFKVQQQRHAYICPQTYIEFLDILMDKFHEKSEETEKKLQFLHAGQKKMEDTNAAIIRMSDDIARLQPKLQEHADLTRALIEKVNRNKDDAQEMLSFMSKEHEIIDEQTRVASARAAETKAELARAEPMYRQAVAAVDNLDKRSIQELRVMLDPPRLVLLVLQCVCMLFGHPDDWAGARVLLGDLSLPRRLKNFDKDNIPPATAMKLQMYTSLPEFDPEEIGRQSKAARDLSLWCCALYQYHQMKCALDKKVARMRAMDRQLDEMKHILERKETEYKTITDQISSLEQQRSDAEASLADLHSEIEACRVRRARASELSEAMKDQVKRWSTKEKILKAEQKTLPGDVVLGAAFTAYAGPFSIEFRQELSSQWTELCNREGVCLAPSFKFQKLYVEPSTVYSWQVNGLPADSNSADSATLVMYSAKWPYIIDPQQQASRWLRKQEQENSLKELKMSDGHILKIIGECLQAGRPVLIDDCEEDFPVALDSVLMPIDVLQRSDIGKDADSGKLGLHSRPASHFMQLGSRTAARSSQGPVSDGIDAISQQASKSPSRPRSGSASWSGVGRWKQEDQQRAAQSEVHENTEDKRLSCGTEDTQGERPSLTDKSKDKIKDASATRSTQAERLTLPLAPASKRPSVRFSIEDAQEPQEPLRPDKRRSSTLSRHSSFDHSSRRSSKPSSGTPTACIASVCLGDDTIPLDDAFRLYLLTSIANPQVNPRLSVMLNLVNFAINFEGLTSQLLCEVLKVESPELEAEHINLLTNWASDMEELKLCEGQILTVLCQAQTLELLDNQDLIVTVQTSLRIGGQLHTRLQDEERREAKFRSTCEMYKSIAEHGALVYIAVLTMAHINPLYVVPLHEVVKCFVATMTEFKAIAVDNDFEKWNFIETETGQQVDGLNEDYVEEIQTRILYSVFLFASRVLFLQDRLVFSFLLCVNLSLYLDRMTKQHYNILMKGTDALLEMSEEDRKQGIKEMNMQGNVSRYTPDAAIISSSSWEFVRALALLLPDTFVKLPADIVNDLPRWRECLPEARPGQLLIDVAREAFEEKEDEDEENQARKNIVLEQFGVSLCAEFPAPWNSLFIAPIEQLLLIRALVPGRLVYAFSGFVHRYLGPRFVDASPVRLEDIHTDSDSRTPLLISSMPGADPTSAVMELAQSGNRRLHIISMAHGQSSKTVQILNESVSDGSWVLLQNCHLAQKWLTPLVCYAMKIVNDFSFTVHGEFRLFVTTQAFPGFPMALLQCSRKIVYECPSGVRSRLLRTVCNLKPDDWFQFLKGGVRVRSGFHGTAAGTIALQLSWRRLLYGLCLFHAVASERSSFGPVGFTVPYEFDDADFVVAREVLRVVYQNLPQDLVGPSELLASRIAQQISWTSLIFVLGEIVYGGRVNDEWDRRCLQCCMRKFVYKDLVAQKPVKNTRGRFSLESGRAVSGHKSHMGRRRAFFRAGTQADLERDDFPSTPEKKYKLPNFAKAETAAKIYDAVISTGEFLPDEEPPELFGLSSEAEVLLQECRSRELLGKFQVINTHGRGASAKSPVQSGQINDAGRQDDTVLHGVKLLHDELPPLNVIGQEEAEKSHDDISKRKMPPKWMFLQHEKDLALDTLQLVHASLVELKEALQGHIPMSDQLENLRLAVLRNQVPSVWLGNRWEPERSLASWIKTLTARVKYFRSWRRTSEMPVCFLINAFYNPRGFLTTILQQEARKQAISVDAFQFRHMVHTELEEPADVQEAPQHGVYLFGMWMQGARWDTGRHVIADCRNNEYCCLMPAIHFIPETDYKPDSDAIYRAPCYQTISRNGQVDTTGQSPNLVTTVDFPIVPEDGSDNWVLRGVALICQLDE